MARLEVIVMSGCPGCDEAHRLADEARRRFPALSVAIIDLSEEPDRQPPNVFAVPTYLVDRRVVSLGTPSAGDLFHAIAAALAQAAPQASRPGAGPEEVSGE